MTKAWKLMVVSAAIASLGLMSTWASYALTLVFEAEHYTWIKPSMTKAASKKASGGHYVRIPLLRPHGVEEAAPSDDGNVTFKINVPQTAKYWLWARVHWYDDCGNSFFVFADKFGAGDAAVLTDSTPQKWRWVRVRNRGYTLTKGYHLIRFQNREDGAKLDQFLLTTAAPGPKGRGWKPNRIYKETSKYLWRPEQ